MGNRNAKNTKSSIYNNFMSFQITNLTNSEMTNVTNTEIYSQKQLNSGQLVY